MTSDLTNEEIQEMLLFILDKIEQIEKHLDDKSMSSVDRSSQSKVLGTRYLTEEQIIYIKQSKESVTVLAKKFNRSRQQIYNIRKSK